MTVSMADEYSLMINHHDIVELIGRIIETMFHCSIVSKMDEVISNLYKVGEEDRLYRILLNRKTFVFHSKNESSRILHRRWCDWGFNHR